MRRARIHNKTPHVVQLLHVLQSYSFYTTASTCPTASTASTGRTPPVLPFCSTCRTCRRRFYGGSTRRALTQVLHLVQVLLLQDVQVLQSQMTWCRSCRLYRSYSPKLLQLVHGHLTECTTYASTGSTWGGCTSQSFYSTASTECRTCRSYTRDRYEFYRRWCI